MSIDRRLMELREQAGKENRTANDAIDLAVYLLDKLRTAEMVSKCQSLKGTLSSQEYAAREAELQRENQVAGEVHRDHRKRILGG